MSFCDFIAPSEEEAVVRLAAVQRVSDVVTSIWPQCAVSATTSARPSPWKLVLTPSPTPSLVQVKVFGSYATGLYLPASDCDVSRAAPASSPLPLSDPEGVKGDGRWWWRGQVSGLL